MRIPAFGFSLIDDFVHLASCICPLCQKITFLRHHRDCPEIFKDAAHNVWHFLFPFLYEGIDKICFYVYVEPVVVSQRVSMPTSEKAWSDRLKQKLGH